MANEAVILEHSQERDSQYCTISHGLLQLLEITAGKNILPKLM